MCLDDHLLVKCSLWSFLNDCSYLIKLCYIFSYLLFILIAFYLFYIYIYIYAFYSTCLVLNEVICYVQVLQDTGVYGSSTSQVLDLGVSEFCLYS